MSDTFVNAVISANKVLAVSVSVSSVGEPGPRGLDGQSGSNSSTARSHEVLSNNAGTTVVTKPANSSEHVVLINFTGTASTRIIEPYSEAWGESDILRISGTLPHTQNISVSIKNTSGLTLYTIVSDASGDSFTADLLYTSGALTLFQVLYPALPQ